MNTTVSFEIAKTLQDKGFDNITFEERASNGELWQLNNFPTIAEVVMWLYEKHGVWLEASLNQFSKPSDLQWMYSITFIEDCTYSYSPKSYTSLTEAYQEAINYYLTKLI